MKATDDPIAIRVVRRAKDAAAEDEAAEPALKVRHLAEAPVQDESVRIRQLAGVLTAAELGAVWRSKTGKMTEYQVGQVVALLIGGSR